MGKQSIIVVEQGQLSADPATPTAGYSSIYPKTDGRWYVKNSDGTVTEVTNINTAAINLFNYYNFK